MATYAGPSAYCACANSSTEQPAVQASVHSEIRAPLRLPLSLRAPAAQPPSTLAEAGLGTRRRYRKTSAVTRSVLWSPAGARFGLESVATPTRRSKPGLTARLKALNEDEARRLELRQFLRRYLRHFLFCRDSCYKKIGRKIGGQKRQNARKIGRKKSAEKSAKTSADNWRKNRRKNQQTTRRFEKSYQLLMFHFKKV